MEYALGCISLNSDEIKSTPKLLGDSFYKNNSSDNFNDGYPVFLWQIDANTFTIINTGIIGDINADNVVDNKDVDVLYKLLKTNRVYTEEELRVIDFVQDGKLAVNDVAKLIQIAEGKIQVTTTTTTTATTATTTTITSSYADKNYTAGDANNDGEISLADAVLILQAISNPDRFGENGTENNHITAQGSVNADVYERGSGLTPQDSLQIQMYMLKLVDYLN